MHRSLTFLALTLTMTPVWAQNSGAPARVTLSRPTAIEGDSGSAASLVFEITRDGPLTSPLTVPVGWLDGTASAGTDFQQSTLSSVTFAAGQSKAVFPVPVLGDTEDEGDETVRLHFPESIGHRVDGSWQEGEEIGYGTGFLLNQDLAMVVPADGTQSRGVLTYRRPFGAGARWTGISSPFFGANAAWGLPEKAVFLRSELISLCRQKVDVGTDVGGVLSPSVVAATPDWLAVIHSYNENNQESPWGGTQTVPLHTGGRTPASLSASGERVAAGLTGLSSNEGARGRGQVTLLRPVSDSSQPWAVEQVIQSPLPVLKSGELHPGDFGSEVLLSGETLVVTAPGAETVAGAANVFLYRLANGVWTLERGLRFARPKGVTSLSLKPLTLDSASLVLLAGDALQRRARNTGGKNVWGAVKTRKLPAPGPSWDDAEADGDDILVAFPADGEGSRIDRLRADGRGGWLTPEQVVSSPPGRPIGDFALAGSSMMRLTYVGEGAPAISVHDRATTVGTILDDEFSIHASDARIFEPASGTAVLRMPVTLSKRMGFPVTLKYHTDPGSATAPSDFVHVANYALMTRGISNLYAEDGSSLSTGSVVRANVNVGPTGTVTIPAGALTEYAPVTVKADSLTENRESFGVTFSSPSAGKLETPSAQGSILDTDHPLFVKTTLALEEPSRYVVRPTEPPPVLKGMLKNPAPAAGLTLPFWVVGSAEEGYDFSLTTSAFEFAPRSRAATLNVTVNADEETEDVEYFFPTLIRDDAPPAGTRWVAGHAAEPLFEGGGESEEGHSNWGEASGQIRTSDLSLRDGVLAQVSVNLVPEEGDDVRIAIWERDERGFFQVVVEHELYPVYSLPPSGPNTLVTESGDILVAVTPTLYSESGIEFMDYSTHVLRWHKGAEGWNSSPTKPVSGLDMSHPVLAGSGDWIALAGRTRVGGSRVEVRLRNAAAEPFEGERSEDEPGYGLAASHDFGGVSVIGIAMDGPWLAVAFSGEAPELKIFHQNAGGPDQWGLVKTLPGTGELHLSGSTLMMRTSPVKARVFSLNDKTRAVTTVRDLTFKTGEFARTELSGDRLLVRGADNSVTIHARNTGGANRWGVFSKVQNTLSAEADAPVAFDGRTAITGLDGEGVAWYHPCEAAATIVDAPVDETDGGSGVNGLITAAGSSWQLSIPGTAPVIVVGPNTPLIGSGLVSTFAPHDPTAAAAWAAAEPGRRDSAALSGRFDFEAAANATITVSQDSPPVLSVTLPDAAAAARVQISQDTIAVGWREAGSPAWLGLLEWIGSEPAANDAETHRFRLPRQPRDGETFRVSFPR